MLRPAIVCLVFVDLLEILGNSTAQVEPSRCELCGAGSQEISKVGCIVLMESSDFVPTCLCSLGGRRVQQRNNGTYSTSLPEERCPISKGGAPFPTLPAFALKLVNLIPHYKSLVLFEPLPLLRGGLECVSL